jgi:tetratricopeptide (TPR) repeat protein
MDPEGSRRFLSRVEALLEVRMFDLAQELAAERLGRLPDDVDARIAMCRIWTRMGRLDQVEEILQAVEIRIGDWSRLHAAMGDICRESGLKKEAVRFYRRFLALNPQGTPHATVAEKLDRLMDAGADALLPEEDQDHYEHISAIAPDFHTMTLAELYLRQNQPDMARHVLNEILRREPDHREAAVMLREIENRMPAPQGDTDGHVRGRIIRELSRWLDNIGRIRGYAT